MSGAPAGHAGLRSREAPRIGVASPFARMPSIPDHVPRSTLSPRPVLALDLGGTQIRAAVVLPDGSRLARVATADADAPTVRPRSSTPASPRSRRARDRRPPRPSRPIVGIGISSPGPGRPVHAAWSSSRRTSGRTSTTSRSPTTSRRRSACRRSSTATRTSPRSARRRTAPAAAATTSSTSPSRPGSAARSSAAAGCSTVRTGWPASSATSRSSSTGPLCGCGGRGHLEAVALGHGPRPRRARRRVDAGARPVSGRARRRDRRRRARRRATSRTARTPATRPAAR